MYVAYIAVAGVLMVVLSMSARMKLEIGRAHV